jgi:hypothetical protein
VNGPIFSLRGLHVNAAVLTTSPCSTAGRWPLQKKFLSMTPAARLADAMP